MIRNLFFKQFSLIFLVEVIVLFAYRKIFNGFFQQDEWLSFSSRIMLQQKDFLGQIGDLISPSVGHYQPLNSLTIQVLFSLFGLNYLPYSISSIILHLIIVFIVFFLAKAIINDAKFALLTALLFGITAASFQATSWVLADTSIHFSTIFSLLSLLLLFKFLSNKRIIFFIWSLIFLLVSLLFKEISIGIFLIFILTILLFASKGFTKTRYIKVIILAGFLYALFRVGMLYIPEAHKTDIVVTESQPIKYIVYNLVTFPFKGVSQSIIPSDVLLDFSYSLANLLPESLVGIKETPSYDFLVQKKILEAVSLTLSLIITFLSIIMWWKNKTNIWGKTVIFALTFILVNTPIFALSPERIGRVFIIDSRNLYLVTFGSSLLVNSIVASLVKRKFIKILLIILPLLVVNIFWLNSFLANVAEVGILRKSILNKIFNEYPKLPEKVVFYTNSDSSFYGLSSSEKIMPFQSGFGQTLLMWYYPTAKFPDEFIINRFLWNITSQGYKEVGDRGFGYFRDFEELAKTVKNNKLDPFSVIAFQFDSEKQITSDISEEVRGRLEGYLVEKQEIPKVTYIISSDQNQKDLQNVKDGNRNTFWDSKLAYENPQSIIIEFPTFLVIAQMQIDSYNNKDQNEVGYKVSISDNGNDWKQVFYAKRYTPDNEGIVNLYMKPQQAKFVKIEQIGYHQFASWVVHEIKLYEKLK